jgi:hypothetical protein
LVQHPQVRNQNVWTISDDVFFTYNDKQFNHSQPVILVIFLINGLA